MGDFAGNVVECPRLEDLSTLAKSRQDPLFAKDEKVGLLHVRVEGHDYLVTRNTERGITVRRLGLDDLPRGRRFRQAITEFFTHQVFDFFQLRGVGTRSRRIARIVEGWTRFSDGQERATGAPLIKAPTVLVETVGKQQTVSHGDAIDDLRNHSSTRIRDTKLSSASAPLDDADRQSLAQNAALMLGCNDSRAADASTPTLTDTVCEAELLTAYPNAEDGADRSAFNDLLSRLKDFAVGASLRDDAERGSAHVALARQLLLGRALSTAIAPDLRVSSRTVAEADALLDALTGGNWVNARDDGCESARHCWHAARQLSRCELGFRLLCELAEAPAGLSGPVLIQWQAALRIYLQVTNHLIATHKTSLATLLESPDDGSDTAASAEARLRASLLAWTSHPAEAAQRAGELLADARQPDEFRLAYRALVGAVKLMSIRELADTAWLKAQRVALKQGTATAADVLDRDEVMALALWRNGFHDDLDGGALALFQRCLNMFVMEWLPREERDAKTGIVHHRVANDSPVALAFNEPITLGATRRTITQRCEDHQAAMGRMTRVLILRMKEAAGLPLREHEALLQEVLELRDAIGRMGLKAEVREAVEGEIEGILTVLDNAARVIDLQDSTANFTPQELNRFVKERGLWEKSPVILFHRISEEIDEIRSRWRPLNIGTGHKRKLSDIDTSAPRSRSHIANAVRSTLLGHWLVCTELGARFHPYGIGARDRDAVVSELADIIDVAPYRRAIDDILAEIDQIDLELLDGWASQSGLSRGTSESSTTPSNGWAACQEQAAVQYFRQQHDIVEALQRGGDKVDAGVKLPQSPHTRRDYQIMADHLVDTNLGTGVRSSITRNHGAELAVNVDVGAIINMIAPVPSASLSFSCQGTAGTTKSFGLIGSSVGGQTITVSESISGRARARAGIGITTPAAVKVGIDGGDAVGACLERGMVLRIPPTPGSRDWALQARHVTNVVFGDKLAEKLSKPASGSPTGIKVENRTGRSPMPNANGRGLRELCWQCFAPLMDGKLALNVFEASMNNHSIGAGMSAGLGLDAGPIPVGVSLKARIGMEKDQRLRQSRVDRTGSTRVAVHGVGTASRCTAAVRLIAGFLPPPLADQFNIEVSAGAMAGVSATFAERGVQHFLRRETLDGVTQASYAWDIVFRDARDLVAHLNTEQVRTAWEVFNHGLPKDQPRWTLEERCQAILHHARHSNQSYMVRRHLRTDKLAEFNAMTALVEGLSDEAVPLDKWPLGFLLLRRSLTLLETDDHYGLGGFGTLAGDHVETQTGIDGTGTLTEVRAVSVPAEQLWFSARLPAARA